jgi:hypothetical protein
MVVGWIGGLPADSKSREATVSLTVTAPYR